MPYTDLHYKFKKIGKNVEIGTNVFFRYPNLVEIGDNVIIDEFCYFTTAVVLGSFIHIAPHCTVIGGRRSTFIMEDFSGIASGCRIICSSDNFLGDGLTNPTIPEEFHSSVTYSDVIIKKHGVLGTGCIVHPGVTVNEGAIAGSASLLTKDIAPWTINVGVPAKKMKDRAKDIILEKERLFLESLKTI
jgi:acetyltransferase-like isoleucine patch superfamily enzyme